MKMLDCRPDNTHTEERELIASAASGQGSAFDTLVSLYSPAVYRLAFNMLGNRDDAQDAQQETFLAAYRNLKKFRGESSFRTWLYSIAVRVCQGKHRRAFRKREEQLDESFWHSLHAEGGSADPAASVDEAIRVRQVLSRMSPPDRLLVVLKYVEGLDHEEIADVLGCSQTSSRSRLTRAKKIFRKLYTETE